VAKRTASAKKQARSGARRAARNRAARSEVKTLIVKARRSLRAPGGAGEGVVDAIRSLDRAAAKRVLHPNNAARRKSRLAKQLAKVAGGGAASAPTGASATRRGSAPASASASGAGAGARPTGPGKGKKAAAGAPGAPAATGKKK